jgi:hypothetical protein
MARLQYFVVYHQNEWKVKFEEKHHGPYVSQALAIRAAVDRLIIPEEMVMMLRSLFRD